MAPAPDLHEVAIANDSAEAKEILALLEKLGIDITVRPTPDHTRIRILVRAEHAEAAEMMLDRITHRPLGDASVEEIEAELAPRTDRDTGEPFPAHTVLRELPRDPARVRRLRTALVVGGLLILLWIALQGAR